MNCQVDPLIKKAVVADTENLAMLILHFKNIYKGRQNENVSRIPITIISIK